MDERLECQKEYGCIVSKTYRKQIYTLHCLYSCVNDKQTKHKGKTNENQK